MIELAIQTQTSTVDRSKTVWQCSQCGLTATEFWETGRLGCAHCYETFAEVITQAVERLHGTTLAPKKPTTSS
jgi:protein arginine kinase activator